MSKDVKIETIYYKSKSDVSLEFGLHGNYPVRLLSSSCDNLTAFFHSLKRAVSRSQIIIIVGGYEGNEYIPSFVARAINKLVFVPEYNKFGVICKEKYPLPEGAVPISPANKKFSGFLIESGPQTIISLTENKKLRADTVNEVIVKYIEEHHNYFLNAAVFKQQGDNELDATTEIQDIGSNTFETEPSSNQSEDVVALGFDTKTENGEQSAETELPDIPIFPVSTDVPLVAEIPVTPIAEVIVDTTIPEVEIPIAETEEISIDDVTSPADESDSKTDEIPLAVFGETESEVSPVAESTEEPAGEETTTENDSVEEESIDIVSHKYRDPESNILSGIAPEDFDFNNERKEY